MKYTPLIQDFLYLPRAVIRSLVTGSSPADAAVPRPGPAASPGFCGAKQRDLPACTSAFPTVAFSTLARRAAIPIPFRCSLQTQVQHLPSSPLYLGCSPGGDVAAPNRLFLPQVHSSARSMQLTRFSISSKFLSIPVV